ncbi:hypothetical protein ACFRQM_40930 [Streptomyces sp. NPDC056831]|uniref:hypothetical protein n=1 Tax=Streptomyces sp. NPDC056831 TaxID=3345954 RepID=UPI0036BF6E03
MRQDLPAVQVAVEPTDAYSIVSAVSSCRGVVAVRDSGGRVPALEDEQLKTARRESARVGL